jgi:hypothetical protein
MGIQCAAMVHPIRGSDLVDIDQRQTVRQACIIESTSRPLEIGDGMSWGGMVKDISAGGLKLGLCFPFSPGTYLAVDLQSSRPHGHRSLVCRVVHVNDHADGTWTLGCEFVKPLDPAEVELLV